MDHTNIHLLDGFRLSTSNRQILNHELPSHLMNVGLYQLIILENDFSDHLFAVCIQIWSTEKKENTIVP